MFLIDVSDFLTLVFAVGVLGSWQVVRKASWKLTVAVLSFFLCREHLLWLKECVISASRAVSRLTFQEQRPARVPAYCLFIHLELWRWHSVTLRSTCWSQTLSSSENISGTDLFFTRYNRFSSWFPAVDFSGWICFHWIAFSFKLMCHWSPV